MAVCGKDRLIAQLDSFDAAQRWSALEELVRLERGQLVPPRRPEVNLHCHTFFSYNAYGYSPLRFAYEAHRYGLEVAGIVDFDVLDGVEEFLRAGRLLRLKTVAGFETRVFIEELKGKVTNSPHEPGVSYFITCGFVSVPKDSRPAAILAAMAACARRRNLKMLRRINEHLRPVEIDYERDVLPLTPSGNATERHLLVAYERQAERVFPDRSERAKFWAEKLGEPQETIERLLGNPVAFKDLVRARLMKYGGVGYAAPEEGSFPRLEEVVQMALDCEALTSGGWLDGTNDGEENAYELFRFLRGKGAVTITIIPDRNWNIADPAEKALKVGKLREAVQAAVELDLPILVGTEMNRTGAKFVDTFSAPEMEPYRQVFLDGAHFAWGHTLLKMTAGVGATSRWALEHFGEDVKARNEFFRRVGRVPYPEERIMQELERMGPAAPEEFLRLLEA